MRTGLLAIALTVGLAVGVGVVVSPSEEPATTARKDPAPAVAIPADRLVIAQSAPCPNRRCPR